MRAHPVQRVRGEVRRFVQGGQAGGDLSLAANLVDVFRDEVVPRVLALAGYPRLNIGNLGDGTVLLGAVYE